MIKIFLLTLYILFFAALMHSQEVAEKVVPADNEAEKTSQDPYLPFRNYKSTYFIFGDIDDQVKAQFSLKYEFMKESGVFIGYSQIMFWRLYDTSSPFSELNYNPELFWKRGDDFDFFQLGFFEHKSNGKDGPSSRSWNRSYAQFRVSTGERLNLGFDVKGFYMWNKAKENGDIDDYTGYYEAEIFFRFLETGPERITDKEEVYLRGGTGRSLYGFDLTKGWVEAGLKFRMLFRSIQPHFFIQLFYGYGESLIGYNEKNLSVRAGIILD